MRGEEVDYWLRQLMQKPRQGKGDDDGQQAGGPVAEVVLGNGLHDEVDVDEVGLERDGADEGQGTQQPRGMAGPVGCDGLEETAEQQECGDGHGDVEHALSEERELAVAHLLQIEAGRKGGDEEQ